MRLVLPRFFAVAGVLALSLASAPARAHHTAGGESPRTSIFRSLVTLGAEGGLVDREGVHGSYAGLIFSGEWLPWQRVWIGARLPVYELRVPGRATALGLGDASVGAGVYLLRLPKAYVSLGASVELPTGNEDDGLGAGHVGLAPVVSATWLTGRLLIQGALGYSASLGDHHETEEHTHDEAEEDHEHGHVHGSWIEPHADHELVYRVGLSAYVTPFLAFGLRAGGSTVLSAEGRGETPLWAGPTVLWAPRRDLLITLGGDLPITEPHRFHARFALSSALVF